MSSEPGTREVAHRLFAAEFEDAALSYSESDEERAPNYVVTPTGLRANRLFVVGVLTEVERVNDDVLRGRVADPTGAFVTYAGQYQPEALSYLDRTDPPAFVALTGKARTFEPDDGDRVFTSVRPEAINAVDADTRDRWVVSAARATLDRLGYVADALEMDERSDDLEAALLATGVPESLAAGIPRAIDFYDVTPAYLADVRRMAVDALELVAGDRDEVRAPERAPDEGGAADLGPLPTGVDREAAAAGIDEQRANTDSEQTVEADSDATAEADAGEPAEADPDATVEAESATIGSDSDGAPDADSGAGATADAGAAEPDGASGVETVDEPDVADEPDATGEPSPEPAAPEADTDTPDPADEEPTGVEAGAESDTAGAGAGSDADDLGDFDPGTGDDPASGGGEAAAPDTDEMYELDEEERREVEEEFGTEFASGNEVDDPGEADIGVPDAEGAETDDAETAGADPVGATAETSTADDAGTAPDAGSEATTASEADPEPANDPEPASASSGESADAADGAEAADAADATDAADVDLESAAVDAMDDLDDGDGAAREEVVALLVDEYGADPGDVEDAIQSALMSGRCYEPGEDRLKAI